MRQLSFHIRHEKTYGYEKERDAREDEDKGIKQWEEEIFNDI